MIIWFRFATALAPLFAAWAVAASVAAVRTSRADLAASARRSLVAATACAVIATAGLVTGLVRFDFAMRFVMQSSSFHMPIRYVPSALLGAPGGALLAFAAVVGVAGLVASIGRAAAGGAAGGAAGSADGVAEAGARRWTTGVLGGMMLVPLAIVLFASGPFDVPLAARGDGAGLSPDLQHGAAGLHAMTLLFGTACAAVSFALTSGAVAARALDDHWSRRLRLWNALAWTSFLVAMVAGARWYALNPARGAWLQAPATALWLIPSATGAWLVHLDTGRATPDRLVTRVLLVAATCGAALLALAYASGAFVTGLAPAVTSRSGAWIAVTPAAIVLLFITQLRRGAGALAGSGAIRDGTRSPIAGWVAHAGFVFIVAAGLGSRFTRERTVALGDAEIFRVKDPFGHQWSFASQGISTLQRENYASLTLSVLPDRDGKRLGMLSAETRSYLTDDGEQPGGPAVITGTVAGAFLETRLTVTDPDGKKPTLRIAFVPLAPWLAVGAWLLAIGTLLPFAWRGAQRAP